MGAFICRCVRALSWCVLNLRERYKFPDVNDLALAARVGRRNGKILRGRKTYNTSWCSKIFQQFLRPCLFQFGVNTTNPRSAHKT